MKSFVKRAVAPLVRFTTVEVVAHDPVFSSFTQHIGRALVDERVRHEPRVVSFRARSRR